MKVLACYNIKGGVGKTTTSVNLAHICASEGARVLVWDLDPQGAASFYFRIKPKVKGGVEKLFKKKSEVDEAIKGTDFINIDLLPADFSYRNMDILLESSQKPRSRFKNILSSLEDEYDYVFLDCPPSFSMVSESVFFVSDALLIPTIPTTLSLRTLEQVLKYSDEKMLKKLSILPFFSMVDKRKNMHKLISEKPPKMGVKFLSAAIPYASEVERMGVERRPILNYAAHSRSAHCYLDLWQEIKERMGL